MDDYEISGWFETEYGVEMVLCTTAADDEDFAGFLFEQYGSECVGVDMELDGTYRSGKDVDTAEVLRFLDIISEE